MEEVVDGVGRQAQLREGDDRRARVGGLARQLQRALGVEDGLGRLDVRHRRRDARETVAVERVEASHEPDTDIARVQGVRVVTWNVNSVKQRMPRLLPWLDERQPDVLCLQETKLTDDAFLDLLADELAERDYAVAVHGQASWNGVAILSRMGLDDVAVGIPGAPGFPDPEARA